MCRETTVSIPRVLDRLSYQAFLCICNRILLSAVGISSSGRLSNFSVRRWHTRLWVFKKFPTSD